MHWEYQSIIKSNSNSLIIIRKGESQNGCFKKTKHAKFSKKRTFLTPWYAHVRTCQIEWVSDSFLKNMEIFPISIWLKKLFLQEGDSEFFSLKDTFMKKSFFEMEKRILENYLTEYSTMFQWFLNFLKVYKLILSNFPTFWVSPHSLSRNCF